MDIRDFISKAPKPSQMSRRAMLRSAGCGFGMLGLGSLLAQADTDPLAPKSPMFPARAKRVIFLFMHGGPSSIDTFDPKPRLDRDNGKPIPFKTPTTVFNISDKVLASPFPERKLSVAWRLRTSRSYSSRSTGRRRAMTIGL